MSRQLRVKTHQLVYTNYKHRPKRNNLIQWSNKIYAIKGGGLTGGKVDRDREKT